MKNKTSQTFCSLFILILMSLMLTTCDQLNEILNGSTDDDIFSPSTEQMIAALKEALTKGSSDAGATLSVEDAFYGNIARKIPLPDEVDSVMEKLGAVEHISILGVADIGPTTVISLIGGDQALEDLKLRINRAAEESSKEVGGIFGDAVKSMTFTDAAAILKGKNTEATEYFKTTTTDPLITAFGPKLNEALDKKIISNISAVSAWEGVVNPYNDFAQKYNAVITNPLVISIKGQQKSLDIINTDLSEFVLDKALTAVFNEMEQEEKKIRENPFKFLSETATKVFNWAKGLIS